MPRKPKDPDETYMLLDLYCAPDVAQELDNVCAAWAAMEFVLFSVFLNITGFKMALARATFYSLHTTRTRTEFILSAAKMVLRDDAGDTKELTELEEMLAKINKTAKVRNKYIHDPWGSWSRKPSAVFQVRMGGSDLRAQGSPVQKHNLTHLVGQIQSETNQLRAISGRIKPLAGTLRRKLGGPRYVDLVFATKELPREIQREAHERRRQSGRS